MVLLKGYPTLLAVNDALDPAHPELNVEIGRVLVKDVPFQRRFDIFVPYRLRVEVQIVLPIEALSDDYTARKLRSKFSGNSKPLFVVESPFEVVHLSSGPSC